MGILYIIITKSLFVVYCFFVYVRDFFSKILLNPQRLKQCLFIAMPVNAYLMNKQMYEQVLAFQVKIFCLMSLNNLVYHFVTIFKIKEWKSCKQGSYLRDDRILLNILAELCLSYYERQEAWKFCFTVNILSWIWR